MPENKEVFRKENIGGYMSEMTQEPTERLPKAQAGIF